MVNTLYLLLLGFVGGLVAVASNPAPYFAALGLVVVAGVGCGMLASQGGVFLSLVLFLIYLGGMLVVFAYSSAMAAEPHPEGWGDRSVLIYVLAYLFVTGVAALLFQGGWYEGSWGGTGCEDCSTDSGDASGVALLYSYGGVVLVVTGWVLLLTLFVVLELVRGLSRGALRAV